MTAGPDIITPPGKQSWRHGRFAFDPKQPARWRWHSPKHGKLRPQPVRDFLRRLLPRLGLALASDLRDADRAWGWHCRNAARIREERNALTIENRLLKFNEMHRLVRDMPGVIDDALDVHRADPLEGRARAAGLRKRIEKATT